MARTRGSSSVIHDDDGELLDKEGKPINAVAHHASAVAESIEAPAPAEVETPRPSAVFHVADERSLRRDIEAWELGQLLKLIMGEWSVRVPDADFAKLPPDVRRHFVRVLEASD